MEYYKPLPDYLRVKKSDIEGDGLFAVDDINTNHIMGITHIKDDEFPNGYSRTPLGGFYNYSETPNCESISDGRFLKLKTLRNIKNGEELTVKYSLYNPTEIKIVITDCDELNDDNIKVDVMNRIIEVNTLTTYIAINSYLLEVWREESDINGVMYMRYKIPSLYSDDRKNTDTWFLPNWEIKNFENIVRYE